MGPKTKKDKTINKNTDNLRRQSHTVWSTE